MIQSTETNKLMDSSLTVEQLSQIQDQVWSELGLEVESLDLKSLVAPLLSRVINIVLRMEMSQFMDSEQRSSGNRLNGTMSKTVKSGYGPLSIETPRDRHGEFEPQFVKKREVELGDELPELVLSLYAKGNSYSDIRKHFQQTLGLSISDGKLSEIVSRVHSDQIEWSSRPLEPVYPIIYLDAIHFKVRDSGRVIVRALYNVIGIRPNGHRELLGFYLGDNESATFWISVLNDLQNRGIEEIWIACIDNLSGFSKGISSVFPKTRVQLCLVHQIRNSLNQVNKRDKAKVSNGLKSVYRAASLAEAELNWARFKSKWKQNYPSLILSWENNWTDLTAYFEYNGSIRRLIYTNNGIESYHRQLRKYTKTKSVFPSSDALLKQIYLSSQEIIKSWDRRCINHWHLAFQQLCIVFDSQNRFS